MYDDATPCDSDDRAPAAAVPSLLDEDNSAFCPCAFCEFIIPQEIINMIKIANITIAKKDMDCRKTCTYNHQE